VIAIPEISLTDRSLPEATDASALALPTRPDDGGAKLGAGGEEVGAAFGADLAALLAREKAKGSAGELVSLPILGGGAVEQILLVGTGDGGPQALRRAGAALSRRVRGIERAAAAVAYDADQEGLRAFVEGVALGAYSFHRKSKQGKPPPVGRLALVTERPAAGDDAVRRGVATASAGLLARDLANTPSSEKSPAWLAEQAATVAEQAGIGCRVRDEAELAAEGFGGILGVSSGSPRPPRLIELSYDPPGRAARRPHVVLVGKGITFDTGGLSLKRGESMALMKTDMSGGGAVIAAMGALAELGVRVRVTGLVAASDNFISGSAQRPGDVITHYGGTTVEVIDTDAEGRLVLADALAYAVGRLAPDLVVDIATLTGAASFGLGRRHAALYATDEELATTLLAAAERSGERLWRMPLVDDYRATLDSEVADLRNMPADPKVGGGSIVAALFLREFVGDRRWAHLDIAGPARADSDEHEVTKGGTGFGARLLLRWLEAMPADKPADKRADKRADTRRRG
jgi:leucyl aminopeptidase